MEGEMTTKTIIIIDDDDDYRKVIGELLRDEEYNVLEATNGKEGLDMVLKQMPDLAIVDIKMPRMTGLELVSKLTELNPELPLIISTSKSKLRDDYSFFKANIIGYLDKPPDIGKLLKMIHQTLYP